MSVSSRTAFLAAAILAGVAARVQGQSADAVQSLKQENKQLHQRVGRLEAELKQTQGELAEIKRLLQGLTKAQPTTPEPPAKAPAAALTQEEVKTLKGLAEQKPAAIPLTADETEKLKKLASSKKKPVWSTLDIKVYGFVRLDAAYDSQRTTGSNYALWVDTEDTRDEDSQFGITPRHSRLGLDIAGPDVVGAKTTGKIEIDFDDTDSHSHNKPSPVMRHGYLKIDWPEHKFSILAGQTWDVISPLNAPTLSYSVLWWQGNIGYRRPQIRLTKEFDLGQDTVWKWEVAAARTIGRRTGLTRAGARPGDTGEDSGLPSVQARTSVTGPGFGGRPTTFGISGHWGEEEIDQDVFDNHRSLVTWSLNLDANVPITDWLRLKGEAYVGENLNAYLGGIGQGVDVARLKEISTQGGWVAASFTPTHAQWKKWQFNVGAGMDDPDSSDMRTVGARTFNSCIFGNAWYAINDKTKVGFELSHLKTDYRRQRDADSIRAQLAFIYSF